MEQKKKQPGRNGGTLNVGGPNPGAGRPRIPSLKKMMDEVMGAKEDGIDPMTEVAKKLREMAKKGNIHAIRLILEYAYGRPTQRMEHSGAMSISGEAMVMDSDKTAAMISAVRAALGERGEDQNDE